MIAFRSGMMNALVAILFSPALFSKALAQSQVLDLRAMQSSEDIAEIRGPWEFFWRVWLKAEDTQTQADATTETGRTWNGLKLRHGAVLTAEGFASYRTVIRLAPSPDGYQIGLKGAGSAFRLMAYPLRARTQIQSVTVGVPAEGQTQGSRRMALLTLHPTQEEDYGIIIHVSNHDYAYGGAYFPLQVGRGTRLSHVLDIADVTNLVGIGAICAVGIYSFMMWLRRRADKPALLLTFTAASAFFRLVPTCSFILNFFSDAWYSFFLRFEFGSLGMGCGSFFLFLFVSFGEPRHRRLAKVLFALSVLTALLPFLTPVRIFSKFLGIPQALIFMSMLMALPMLYQAWRQKREGINIVLAGCLLVFSAFIYDLIVSLASSPAFYLNHIAVLIFLILQSQVVALRAALAYNRAERLTHELETRNQEIIHLNKNLERLADTKARRMRSLLDHIPQGVCSIDQYGMITDEYSMHLPVLLGTEKVSHENFVELVLKQSRFSPDELDQISQALYAIVGDGVLSYEMNANKLPAEICYELDSTEKWLKATWTPELDENETVQRLLITLLDITLEKNLEQKTSHQKTQLQMIQELVDSPAKQVAEFFSTSHQLLYENQSLLDETRLTAHHVRMLLINAHTLKGAARTLQFRFLADEIHKAEASFKSASLGVQTNCDERECWQRVIEVFNNYRDLNRNKLQRSDDASRVVVDRQLLAELHSSLTLLRFLPQNVPGLGVLVHQRDRIADCIFERLPLMAQSWKNQALQIARDLGKESPRFYCQLPDLYVSIETRVALDKAMIHVLRNALDHGIEYPEERRLSGKASEGEIHIKGQIDNGQLLLQICDDGRGLSLFKLREKAQERQIMLDPTHLQSVASLVFESGLSTAEKETHISGRGIGMDAIRQHIRDCGGDVWIEIPKMISREDSVPFTLHLALPIGEAELRLTPVTQAAS